MLPRNTRQKRRCIARSHLFHVSLAFISLEHQLEAACKRYTCQAKRLALPAGSLFMDETSPRPKKRRGEPECSLSSPTRNTIVFFAGEEFPPSLPLPLLPSLSLSFSLRGVGSTIFQLFHRVPPFHGISIGNGPIFSSVLEIFRISYENFFSISPIINEK